MSSKSPEVPNLKIRFAIVGMGHIGQRHATMIRQNSDCELVAVADIDHSLHTSLNKTFEVPVFSSIDDLLGSGLQFDVVNVCTPNSFHGPQAIQILKSGYHVVVEKPMCLHKSDCEEVIHYSMQTGKLVFCVMQNRYSPPSIWLREILDSGILGKIFQVQINCFWNRDSRYYKADGWKGKKAIDGGTLFTQFSHFIDIMYWLFGDIKNIHSRLYNFNHSGLTEFEDSGFAQFDFLKGGSGTLSFSTSVWDKNLESSMTIIGENGSIKVGGQYMNEVEYCHIKDYQMPQLAESSPANDYGHYKGSASNHHFVIENVIDVLKGRTVATTNALEGMKVVEIIEKIYSADSTNHRR